MAALFTSTSMAPKWVRASRTPRRYIFLPQGAQALQNQPAPDSPVELLIGPEGGFTPEEAQMARAVGFTPILLGPRVLRTETAAIAAIAALQILWGDLN